MLGLSIEILLRFWFAASVALYSTAEVIVLACWANPSSIWKIEIIHLWSCSCCIATVILHKRWKLVFLSDYLQFLLMSSIFLDRLVLINFLLLTDFLIHEIFFRCLGIWKILQVSIRMNWNHTSLIVLHVVLSITILE